MTPEVKVKIYPAPPFSEREALRYASAGDDEGCVSLLREAYAEAKGSFRFAVCYAELPLAFSEDALTIGETRVKSASLSKNLAGCDSVIVFAATVGVEIDRLIKKYSLLSPAKALMLQGIGAERIEALCDAFCADVTDGRRHKPRFSAGYGDLPIEYQREIFALLSPERHIGLTLNDSLLMSPTKSVSAVVGIKTD